MNSKNVTERLFELNLLFNMTFTRHSSLVNNKHPNITFSIDLTDDVDLVDCDRQLPKKELILFSWNTREADINRPDEVVFWRMKFSLNCLPKLKNKSLCDITGDLWILRLRRFCVIPPVFYESEDSGITMVCATLIFGFSHNSRMDTKVLKWSSHNNRIKN